MFSRSIIIDSLNSRSVLNDTGLAYIYCNYKERETQIARNLLGSLLQQLVQQQSKLPDVVTVFYEKHLSKQTSPSFAEYLNFLQLVIKDFSDVFVVIDALDEHVGERLNDEFVTGIQELQPSIYLLVTSRWVPSIELGFENSIKLEIRATKEDITKYLIDRIQRAKRLKCHIKDDPSLHDAIVNTIVENSQGMYVFHSAYLQIYSIYFVDIPNKVPASSATYRFISKEAASQSCPLGT